MNPTVRLATIVLVATIVGCVLSLILGPFGIALGVWAGIEADRKWHP